MEFFLISFSLTDTPSILGGSSSSVDPPQATLRSCTEDLQRARCIMVDGGTSPLAVAGTVADGGATVRFRSSVNRVAHDRRIPSPNPESASEVENHSDSVFLRATCDSKVHVANKLASLCEHLTCKADSASPATATSTPPTPSPPATSVPHHPFLYEINLAPGRSRSNDVVESWEGRREGVGEDSTENEKG